MFEQITGAGGGLGREMAVQLATLGARLVLCDIDEVLSCYYYYYYFSFLLRLIRVVHRPKYKGQFNMNYRERGPMHEVCILHRIHRA